jgi:hypothetical protein
MLTAGTHTSPPVLDKRSSICLSQAESLEARAFESVAIGPIVASSSEKTD